MSATQKAYKGLAMEGPIAAWYTKNTGRDKRRFVTVARAIHERVAPGSRILEVAPGPGYLAIELAQAGYRVTGLDISQSFVRIAQEQAALANVEIDVRHGNASDMPFAPARFDFVVCVAAFKNFTDPLGAIDEFHRVLRPGGEASIYDLRKDASADAIAAEVRDMQLSRVNAALTRFVFRHTLIKNAYSREAFEALVARSRFRTCEITADGIGLEVRLRKPHA